VRLGVKADALHVGGINVFGHTFGNYAQDVVLRLEYVPGQPVNSASANGAAVHADALAETQ
jgi:hypothetical protein